MDQGLVALVTAGVGLVGAIGGAAIGGFAAARGARSGAEMAARATARQVRDQALFDHAHWLRERRLEACRDFLGAYDEYAGAATAYEKLLTSDPNSAESAEPVTLRPSTLALHRIYFVIRILGPEALRQAAAQVRRMQEQHAENLYAWRTAYLRRDGQDLATARTRNADCLEELRDAYDAFVSATNRAIATPEQPE
jgi:hypothetical protein